MTYPAIATPAVKTPAKLHRLADLTNCWPPNSNLANLVIYGFFVKEPFKENIGNHKNPKVD